jgi:outer membrane protein TolC
MLLASVLCAGLWGQSVPIVSGSQSDPVELLTPEFESSDLSPEILPTQAVVDAQDQQWIPHAPLSLDTSLPGPSTGDDFGPVSLSPELAPFAERIQTVEDAPFVPVILPPLPEGFEPWWIKHMTQQVRPLSRPLPVTVDWLIWRALDHSPQVLAMNLDPSIRETEIFEQQAAFDWTAFVDSNFNANSDPVGNTLTTGGSPRFRDRIFGQRMGFRRATTTGGEFEASQRIGYQNNNSLFFLPTQQGTSILTLSFTQPLLARSGRVYNTSRIAMAHLETGMAQDELAERLQDHLMEVTRAYWELYRARATLAQKMKLLSEAEYILERLEARKEVDSQERQVLRAQAEVASRRSEIARAAMSIGNAESRLRFLVNDPQLLQGGLTELLPEEAPLAIGFDLSMGDSLITAIQNRPEIAQALKAVRNKSLETGMAESEYKPALDFVVGTYVSGLEGKSDIPQSFLNQFNQGEPGWWVGFLFDMPLGRRAAMARLSRRQLEMQRTLLEFRTSVERTLTEVEIAVREVRTTYQEMLSTFHAMHAAETEAQFLAERWRLLVGSDQSSTLLLEDLLDAQERATDEEGKFVSAQVGYVLALAALKRTMGVLLTMGEAPSPMESPVNEEPFHPMTSEPPSPGHSKPIRKTGPSLAPPSPQ